VEWRVYDLYGRPVVSLAMLGEPYPSKRGRFGYSRWGWECCRRGVWRKCLARMGRRGGRIEPVKWWARWCIR